MAALAHKPGRQGRQAALLLFCVAGIWASYLTQGVVQENLSTKKFGPEQQRFEHLTFLNLAQNVVCFTWASLMLLCFVPMDQSQPPIWVYATASVSNTIGPALGIEALKYISYPAQVLAKSSKMIPVMLMGAMLYRVHYTVPEYVCTILVAGGVSLFALFKSSAKAAKKLAHPNAPLGYLMCFLNLGLDGFTNATQDSITERCPRAPQDKRVLPYDGHEFLEYDLHVFLHVHTPWGGGFEAWDFCFAHREAAFDIILFCLCGAVGQNFIFLTINTFGALTNTTITTTRKFMSILISAVWTGSPLAVEQWGGVFMVFAGLSMQIFLKWQRSRARAKRTLSSPARNH
eukprot:SM000014S00331  [mRNA]  locus=s14:714086:716375:- [translate_table: standard]